MKNEKKNNEIRYIDLFGGVGGFRLGIERATNNQSKTSGYETKEHSTSDTSEPLQRTTTRCVFYNDIDKYAVQTYNKNFGENYKPTDIRTIKADSIPDFDMLCGGFPCQAFSIAGKRRGFQDTRGTLFFEIARIIKAKRPKIVFLENVKGLLNHEKGKTFSVIIQTISELGYDVQWMVLNSKFFGVPQNRERVFIIGSLRGTSRSEILPFRESSKDVAKGDRKNSSTSDTLSARYWKGGAGTHIKIPTNTKLGYDVAEARKDGIRLQYEDSKIARGMPMIQMNGTKGNSQGNRIYSTDGTSTTLAEQVGGQGAKTGLYAVLTPNRENKRQNGRRMKEDGEPSFTLTGQDVHGVAIQSHSPRTNDPKKGGSGPLISEEHCFTIDRSPHYAHKDMKIRRLTPIECERLQGFPDGWTEGVSDTQRYKQMGNAVTVNVIQAIAERLLK